jgi:type IV pilus assembly protein PilX
MTRVFQQASAQRGQRGMVLIISLVILLSLTLLGLAAIQNTSLEERMAGNLRAENIAFQAAEAALRSGEAAIAAWTAQPLASTNGDSGVWELDYPDADPTDEFQWWQVRDATWWTDHGIASPGFLFFRRGTDDVNRDLKGDDVQLSAPQPRYLIEERGPLSDSLVVGQQNDMVGRRVYQVTGRGTDLGGRAEAFVRSTFARRF